MLGATGAVSKRRPQTQPRHGHTHPLHLRPFDSGIAVQPPHRAPVLPSCPQVASIRRVPTRPAQVLLPDLTESVQLPFPLQVRLATRAAEQG